MPVRMRKISLESLNYMNVCLLSSRETCLFFEYCYALRGTLDELDVHQPMLVGLRF